MDRPAILFACLIFTLTCAEIHLEHHRHLKSVSLESRVRSLILEVGWRVRMVLHKSYRFDIILSRN